MILSDALPLQGYPGAPCGLGETWPWERSAETLKRVERMQALGTDVERASVLELIEHLGDAQPIVRWEAGCALAHVADRLQQRSRLARSTGAAQQRDITFAEALALMGQQLLAEDPLRRAAAADGLGHWRHERATRLLLQALDDPQPIVRMSAAASLGHVGQESCAPALIERLSDPSIWVRRAAAEALGALQSSQAVPELRRVALQDGKLAAAAAIVALGHVPGQRTRRALLACLGRNDIDLRWYTVRSLGQVGGIGAIPALRRLLDSPDAVFGRPLGDLAAWAIAEIERRETGWWNRLRKIVILTYSWIARLAQSQRGRHHPQMDDTLDDDAVEIEES